MSLGWGWRGFTSAAETAWSVHALRRLVAPDEPVGLGAIPAHTCGPFAPAEPQTHQDDTHQAHLSPTTALHDQVSRFDWCIDHQCTPQGDCSRHATAGDSAMLWMNMDLQMGWCTITSASYSKRQYSTVLDGRPSGRTFNSRCSSFAAGARVRSLRAPLPRWQHLRRAVPAQREWTKGSAF